MRWGYGGRQRSCDGEEGGGGELDAPRTKNDKRRARATLTVDESHDGGDGRTVTSFRHGRWRGFGQRRRCGRDRARRGEAVRTAGRNATSQNGAALSGRRRAVPTAHLMRGRGAARGSHATTARCQAGLARTAASDRWDPLVSVF
jgi:hypothetical protein